MPQAGGAGLHGAQQVSVRIHRNDVCQVSDELHEPATEEHAVSQEEHSAGISIGQDRQKDERIQITLVIGADQERSLFRKVIQALRFEA